MCIVLSSVESLHTAMYQLQTSPQRDCSLEEFLGEDSLLKSKISLRNPQGAHDAAFLLVQF